MGWTNSVPIFHEDITHILHLEVPHITVPFINDVPIKGPDTNYRNPNGLYKVLRENPNIRCFIWEHFQNVNRVVCYEVDTIFFSPFPFPFPFLLHLHLQGPFAMHSST